MKYEVDFSKPYSKGEYNKFNDVEQWIRISEGCPNRCSFCRESFENPELKILNIPNIVRNQVKILDMNLLCKKEALEIIKFLGSQKVNNKKVYYELLCGIDYRFLTFELAKALKDNNFINIRLAWDYGFVLQRVFKKVLNLLIKAGYNPRKDITFFFICNWKTSYKQNLLKLDLCKVWNVKVADCYFDNQLYPNVEPIYWKVSEIKDFRQRVRRHNLMVNFKIDPEYIYGSDLNEF